jgi:hypothetical protein
MMNDEVMMEHEHPGSTGCQPVLPGTEHSALFSSFVIRISSLIAHLYR